MPIPKNRVPQASANQPYSRLTAINSVTRPILAKKPASANPMSGGAAVEPDPLRDPIANRNTEGPRQAGVTPRPTDKPTE